MRDFLEATLTSGKGMIIAPVALAAIVALLPVVAVDYVKRKAKKKFL